MARFSTLRTTMGVLLALQLFNNLLMLLICHRAPFSDFCNSAMATCAYPTIILTRCDARGFHKVKSICY